MGTYGSYLFRRGSTWYVKLRNTTGRTEKSLHTSDRLAAQIAAAPLIDAHRAALLAAKPRIEIAHEREYEPGLHTGLNGERIYATPTEVHYLDEAPIRIEPNGVTVRRLIARGPQSAQTEFGLLDEAHGEAVQPKPPVRTGDDEIVETYCQHNNLSEHFRREANAVWATYKQLTNDKPLKDATRDDGRLLVKHFADAGNKRATIAKKVGWLRAACKLAIGEKRLVFNPFVDILPKVKRGERDNLRRVAIDDAGMAKCKAKLGDLEPDDRALFTLLATTGMRLSEAFQIDGEQEIDGVRFVVVGTKTDASLRRVPLPADWLAFRPEKIEGRLFPIRSSIELAAKAASKRLNDFLDDCGLTDPGIVVHSLRHRAARRLRAAGILKEIRRAIGGWVGSEADDAPSEETSYGVSEDGDKGFPMTMLKDAIDRIGF